MPIVDDTLNKLCLCKCLDYVIRVINNSQFVLSGLSIVDAQYLQQL